MYWFTKNIFNIGDKEVQEELLFQGDYYPQYYKARRQYENEKKGQWAEYWIPIKFAVERIIIVSAELTKDHEITEQEEIELEGE